MNRIIFSVSLVSLIALASCRKIIEVDLPIEKITGKAAFENESNATRVVSGIFLSLSENAGFFNFSTSLVADDLGYAGTELISYYTNTLAANPGTGNWYGLYSVIFRCNAAIEGLAASETLADGIKSRLTGEAKFVRAFCYFYLLNLYGEVPVVTSTDYINNLGLGRAAVQQVYTQIIDDLNEAHNTLTENYLNIDGNPQTTERLRPNKFSAAAMLARVYLFQKNWEKANEFATEVIDQPLFMLEPFENIFKTNSKECIWQLQPTFIDFNTEEGKLFVLNSSPDANFPYFLRDAFYNIFDNTDLRKNNWIGTFTDNSVTPAKEYHFPYKYKAGAKLQSESYTEYNAVIRLSEMYLVRAEAKAYLGNLTGAESAKNDLNEVRNRAGLTDLDTDDADEIITAVQLERRKEFFTEWSHRWFDLKRTETINTIMPPVTAEKGGSWAPTDQLFPISFMELERSPNLRPQNPGY